MASFKSLFHHGGFPFLLCHSELESSYYRRLQVFSHTWWISCPFSIVANLGSPRHGGPKVFYGAMVNFLSLLYHSGSWVSLQWRTLSLLFAMMDFMSLFRRGRFPCPFSTIANLESLCRDGPQVFSQSWWIYCPFSISRSRVSLLWQALSLLSIVVDSIFLFCHSESRVSCPWQVSSFLSIMANSLSFLCCNKSRVFPL